MSLSKTLVKALGDGYIVIFSPKGDRVSIRVIDPPFVTQLYVSSTALEIAEDAGIILEKAIKDAINYIKGKEKEVRR